MLDRVMSQVACLMSLKRDSRAVTALEYGLIASVMAAAIIAGFGSMRTSLQTRFQAIATSISTGS